MRTVLIIIIACLYCQDLNAQNILENGSFEQHTSCPDFFTVTPNDQIGKAIGWNQGTQGTPDYFHLCGTNQASAPNTYQGYQYPITGDSAFVGMYPATDLGLGFREYLLTEIPTLQIGETYTFSFLVNVANESTYRSECLGVLFGTEQFSLVWDDIDQIYNPHVDFYNTGFLQDTLDWNYVEGSFIADSSYTKLYFGCFRHNDSINFIPNPGGQAGGDTYYFFDQLCLKRSGKLCLDSNLDLPAKNVTFLIRSYPNPCIDQLSIESQKPIQSISIHSACGQNCFVEFESIGNLSIIDTRNLDVGFYLLGFIFEDGTASNLKFVKE